MLVRSFDKILQQDRQNLNGVFRFCCAFSAALALNMNEKVFRGAGDRLVDQGLQWQLMFFNRAIKIWKALSTPCMQNHLMQTFFAAMYA